MTNAFAAIGTRQRTLSRCVARVRVGIDLLGRLALGALVAFHGWLLWSHVVEGRVFDPATAARWALSVLILLGFRALRRSDLPLFWGRRAVGLWLVVVLLHASALGGDSPRDLPLAVPETAAAFAQLAAPAGLLLGALLLALLSLAAVRGRTDRLAWTVASLLADLPAAFALLRSSPRAPPLAAPSLT